MEDGLPMCLVLVLGSFSDSRSVRSVNEATKVSADSGTNENPHITHRHIDTSTRVQRKLVIRFGSRIADSRKELVVRFGADCVAKARGAVLMGNLRQQKPRRKLKIGILLATGTGSPWSICIMRSGMGKLHKQAAARGRLVGQRRIAGIMS